MQDYYTALAKKIQEIRHDPVKILATVRGSVQLGEASGTTCAIAQTLLENPKLKQSSWSLMIFSLVRLQAANREVL